MSSLSVSERPPQPIDPNNSTSLLEKIQSDEKVFNDASETLKKNSDFVQAAVSANHKVLQFVAKPLNASRDIILAAVMLSESDLREIKDGALTFLKKIRVKENIRENTRLYLIYSQGCEAINKLGLSAIQAIATEQLNYQNFQKTQNISSGIQEKLKNIPLCIQEFILNAAVAHSNKRAEAFQYASTELKTDYAFIQHMLTQIPQTARFVPRDPLLRFYRMYGANSFQYLSQEQKADLDIVGAAVKKNGLLLQFVPTSLISGNEVAGRSIVLAAVEQNGRALQFAPEELKDDFDVVSAAVKQNGLALQFASEKMKMNEQIVFDALKKDLGAWDFCPEPWKTRHSHLVTEATGSDV